MLTKYFIDKQYLDRGSFDMSRTRSTALERLVITLLGGLNRFYGIPTLALGPGTVHLRYFNNVCPKNQSASYVNTKQCNGRPCPSSLRKQVRSHPYYKNPNSNFFTLRLFYQPPPDNSASYPSSDSKLLGISFSVKLGFTQRI